MAPYQLTLQLRNNAQLILRTTCRAATGEVADMALEYLPPDRLGLAHADLPRSAWPPPRRHLWPFGAGPGQVYGQGRGLVFLRLMLKVRVSLIKTMPFRGAPFRDERDLYTIRVALVCCDQEVYTGGRRPWLREWPPWPLD